MGRDDRKFYKFTATIVRTERKSLVVRAKDVMKAHDKFKEAIGYNNPRPDSTTLEVTVKAIEVVDNRQGHNPRMCLE